MVLPKPVSGLVIRYSYLWHEHARGQQEGVEDRPCALILVMQTEAGGDVVTALPITHTPPDRVALALEIPQQTKKRLGLDTEHSWVVLTEANRFIWPGPDLRPVGLDFETVAYGPLPASLFNRVRDRFVAILKAGQAKAINRAE